MVILWNVLTILLIALVPRLMILACARRKLLAALGPVFLCYAAGFLLSFVIPKTGTAMSISEILVPIAIPLILFSADLRSVKSLARPTLISFALVVVSVLVVSTAGYLAFRGQLAGADKLAGMTVGLYTGGTPNLIAIGVALGVDSDTIVLANTVDLIVGGVYFCLLLSVFPRFVHRVFPKMKEDSGCADPAAPIASGFVPEKQRVTVRSIISCIPVVLLAVGCLAAAAGIALLITGKLDTLTVMLVVTVAGIALSFVRSIREKPGTFAIGQYIIYMFSFGIGMSFDLSNINTGVLLLLLFFAVVQFGSVVLHLILARVFKIDGDTTVITSVAGIFGPAFIIPVSEALKNKRVILPGIICGILGYVIGNFLGIGLAQFLLWLG